MADRLAMRERPPGPPVMYQSWGTLLFLHWQIPVAALRPMIPAHLSIDTFDGSAWISVTPFTVWGARPAFMPPLPWLSAFHEINVRTYVHREGMPGVWFFSLDASSLAAVIGARSLFHLPYHHARMLLQQRESTVIYRTTRKGAGPAAVFDATWICGADLPPAEPGSLEFFLVERYCLYTAKNGSVYRCRIFHHPWPLHKAALASCESTMIEAAGLPAPHGEPLLQGGGPVHVAVWPIEKL
jgi:uncharacterized protein YqjF (DUF2071 family)